MRKVFCMLLALTMMLPMLPAMAEDVIIGGADGPTGIWSSGLGGMLLTKDLMENAIAAGRRVVSTVKVTELSGLELDTPELEQAVAELLSKLTLTEADQGDEGVLTLSVGDQEILDLGIAMAGKDTYIKSSLVGGTVVVSEEEAQGVLDRLMKLMVQYDMMTETDAANTLSILEQMPSMVEEAMVQTNQMDDALALLSSLDYTALAPIAELGESRRQVVDSPVVPKNCDAPAEGVQWVFTEDDVKQAALCILQFVQDNPEVQELLNAWLGLPTEEQLDSIWEAYGELYLQYGWYESKEAFYAARPTLQMTLEQVKAELPETKVMEGDYVVSCYLDENGEIVYFNADVTFYEEAELVLGDGGKPTEIPASTLPISVTYTRQTLPDGVYHVCNISVDGETLSTNVVTADNSMSLTMDVIASDGSIVKIMDLVVYTRPGADENTPDGLSVELDIYEGDGTPAGQLLLEGELLSTETRSYLSGKFQVKNCMNDEVVLSLSVMSDNIIQGVDFEGQAKVRLEVENNAFEVETATQTTDPVDSIMVGQVTRLAELDDAAFEKWFTGAIGGMNVLLVNVMNVVPAELIQYFGAAQ